MLEPPWLSHEAIVSGLEGYFGILVGSLESLASGLDSRAWAYRVEAADGQVFFLKVRSGPADLSTLAVSRYLADHGVPEVVAPLPARRGALFASLEDYSLTLYPFITGELGADARMERREWVAYGSLLRRVHGTELPAELRRGMRHEDFQPSWSGLMRRLQARIDVEGSTSDDAENELVAFWRKHEEAIRRLAEKAQALGTQLRENPRPMVLCHGDVHTWNLIIGGDRKPRVIDWDDAIIAPKECDLMFAIGGLRRDLVSRQQQAWFRSGYGEVEVDAPVLIYYRHVRALSDIGAFAESVILLPGSGQEKRAALEGFVSLFDPGAIVDLARQSGY